MQMVSNGASAICSMSSATPSLLVNSFGLVCVGLGWFGLVQAQLSSAQHSVVYLLKLLEELRRRLAGGVVHKLNLLFTQGLKLVQKLPNAKVRAEVCNSTERLQDVYLARHYPNGVGVLAPAVKLLTARNLKFELCSMLVWVRLKN